MRAGFDPPHPFIMEYVLIWLDPWLIAPYRWLPQPEIAFMLGTGLIALQTVLLGLASLRFGKMLHAKRLAKWHDKMQHYHTLSEQALATGDKELFKAINRQAHDAFGHHFSLGGALFVVSLWPVPFAMAWLSLRFAQSSPELPFALPLLGQQPGLMFWFLLCYIPLRMLVGTVFNRLLPQKD